MKGLKAEDAHELNTVHKMFWRERTAEMYIKYANDPTALDELAHFDPESNYTRAFDKFSNGLFGDDEELAWYGQKKLVQYFEKHGLEVPESLRKPLRRMIFPTKDEHGISAGKKAYYTDWLNSPNPMEF